VQAHYHPAPRTKRYPKRVSITATIPATSHPAVAVAVAASSIRHYASRTTSLLEQWLRPNRRSGRRSSPAFVLTSTRRPSFVALLLVTTPPSLRSIDVAEAEHILQTVNITPRANFRFEFPDLRVPEAHTLDSLSQLRDVIDLDKVIAVAGFGEVGPWGSSRTRLEIEARRLCLLSRLPHD
jgi:hypothetical protein